jgi:hypothetical protein
MRRTMLVLAALAAFGGPALAQRDFETLYYWEDEFAPPGYGRFGWSDQPRAWRIRPGPIRALPGESLTAFCGRQVGRALRQDYSGQTQGTIMLQGCLANGGRL